MTLLFCVCIAFFLLAITPRFCCNFAIYSTGHFIADMTLYQTIESGKDISLYRPDDRGMSHTNDGHFPACNARSSPVLKEAELICCCFV